MSKTIIIPNGFITFAETNFNCPYCKKEYDDIDDFYLKRCNKNKRSTTSVKCDCKNKFGMTYDMTGKAVSFKLK